MADSLTQKNRVGRLATPLGEDKLLLARFTATEAMGELFEIRAEALSEDGSIDFNSALGLTTSIHLDTSDDVGRDFSGILTEARRLGQHGDFFVYSLVLRPWLFLLSLTSDSRIFKDMKPVEIIKKVFDDRGFKNVSILASGDYPTLEYTVQYRETDLNFVLRMMEKYGIYYYFEFEPGDGSAPSDHMLVLADTTAHPALKTLSTVTYMPSSVGDRHDVQQFNSWTRDQAVVSGVFALNDYNYEKPSADLLVSAEYPYRFAHGSMEIYDYPGGYDERGEGKTLAEVVRDADRVHNENWSASGYAPTLTPGYTITRDSTDTDDAENGDYLILRCNHSFGTQAYEGGGAGGGGIQYSGLYELAKDDVPYRMQLRTRRPVIVGAQSALVVGQEGEEIDVDKEGRITVQFYWDRKKTSSRRVRVAEFWAGSYRGAKFLPRIGDEVMVHYEEGDPDRPIVIGSVYNGTNPIPSELPAKKNISGILTKSTKKSNGYNMLTFDDTSGHEVVKLRSQRDLMFKALRNEQRDILGSQTENVGGDITQNVGGDDTITVGSLSPPGGGNYSLTATQSIVLTVGPSSIEITKEGITITAPMIYLNP